MDGRDYDDPRWIEWEMESIPSHWDTIAFLAECPDNPFLVRWGWWDR